MPRHSQKEKNVRNLLRLGEGSIGLTIPIDIVYALKLKKGQKVVVEQRGQTIVIKDWKR